MHAAGLILNTYDDRLPGDSPWRTRREVRHHPALFEIDGLPVYEVWFWSDEFQRWFVMSRGYDLERVQQGVIYFDTIEQLRAVLARQRGLRG